jgi:cytosine/uracil/thiamine/allantoin permease
MDGYTIFLGPFAGIMVTDVSVTCRHARSRLDVNLRFALHSFTWCIKVVSTFPQCMTLQGDIVTLGDL